MNDLFSGKASVKHLTTTEEIGSPRLFDEEQQQNKPFNHVNIHQTLPEQENKKFPTSLGSHKCLQLNKWYPEISGESSLHTYPCSKKLI